jgi:hypothetical protein
VTLISAAFAPLAQVIAARLGCPALPIVVIDHPVGDMDPGKVRQKGFAGAEACAQLLVTPVDALEREFRHKRFPPAPNVVPKF